MRSYALLCAAVFAVGCGPQVEEEETVVIPVGDQKADQITKVTIPDGSTVTAQFTATGAPLEITVDCKPPADPDTVGTEFTVTSAIAGISSSTLRGGYWQWAGDVAAGARSIKLKGKNGASSCSVRIATATGACTSYMAFHSPITGHTHVTVGTTVSTWGSFPVSGNHWGAWAKWNTVYDGAIKKGFLIHNLEHGGVVMSYGCSSASSSSDCGQAKKDLVGLKSSFGEQRVIVTPDPSQPTRYGVRTWRWGYQSDCFDAERMDAFMQQHYRDGREDEDSDPPVPYDPTTTNVPCDDIMSAPDSCQ
jgi:hypothetical protein